MLFHIKYFKLELFTFIFFVLLYPEYQVFGADLECQNDFILVCCGLNCDCICSYKLILSCIWILDAFYFMILGLHDQCIFRLYSVSFNNLSVIKDVRLYIINIIFPNGAERILRQTMSIELLECVVADYFALV